MKILRRWMMCDEGKRRRANTRGSDLGLINTNVSLGHSSLFIGFCLFRVARCDNEMVDLVK
jgi:hypothetical protein